MMYGVLQEGTLALYLFTIVLDYVMREAMIITDNFRFTLSKRRSRRHPPVRLSDLDFADDIALTLDTFCKKHKHCSQAKSAN